MIRNHITILLYSIVFSLGAWETPTMGWSSWNTYRNEISKQVILSQAKAMTDNGLLTAGYNYVNIDDGAFNGRDTCGNLQINLDRFPGGMKSVVDSIHSMGMKAGTYSDAGRNTCASYYDNDIGGIGTGLFGHEQQDFEFLMNDLGFDFIKVDFCGGDPTQNSEQLDLDEEERYREIGRALSATGRDGVRLNVCRWNYPGTWVEDVATSWRISEDIWPGWESVRGIIAQNLYLSAYASKGRFNDMDMLEVGRGMTHEEDCTHFGMWCILASPLLIGCDLTMISKEALDLLLNPELIAINQDPLALQAYVADVKDGAYVLVKDLEVPYSCTRVMAVYNPSDEIKSVCVDFSNLDLGGEVKVRDLFERKETGTFIDSINVEVPAHGTRIYRLEAFERYERKRYEAEVARLTGYQELVNHKIAITGVYLPDKVCSGGMKAGWLGMRADNDIVWYNVYSLKGGEYTLRIVWLSGEPRGFNVSINGDTIGSINGDSGSWDMVTVTEIPVKLKKGENTIRFWNSKGWMPDFDYIEIIRDC